MKKRLTVILLAILLLLLIPVPTGVYKDGGTREYTALTYKIVSWNRLTDGGIYKKVSLYPFPLNFLSIDRLYARQEAKKEREKETLSFSAQCIRTDGYHEDIDYPVFSVISSRTELDVYYQRNKDLYSLGRREDPASDSTIGFLDACDKYTDEFFETKNLILVLLEEGSGSIRHGVESVEKRGEGVDINIKRTQPEIGTCDMAEWHIIIETEKSVKKDTPITVYIDGVNPHTVPRLVSCGKHSAGISLKLPKSWEYEINEDADVAEFSLSFRPKGKKGSISVEYWDNAFGVCGTGLENERISLGQYKADKGTYDGKAVWDYIAIEDTPGDYVIMNRGADEWLGEYDETVMEILSTLTVADGTISESRAIEIAKKQTDREYDNVSAWFEYERGVWFVKFWQNDTKTGTIVSLSREGKVIPEYKPKEDEDEEISFKDSSSDTCGYPTADYFTNS